MITKEREMLYSEETYNIRGAAYKVHELLGPGFSEAIYQDALEKELRERHIPYEREKEISVYYKGEPLKSFFKADFVCYGTIIVELKATSELIDAFKSQVINYLKATGYEVGLLMNFGESSLNIERIYRKNDGVYSP